MKGFSFVVSGNLVIFHWIHFARKRVQYHIYSELLPRTLDIITAERTLFLILEQVLVDAEAAEGVAAEESYGLYELGEADGAEEVAFEEAFDHAVELLCFISLLLILSIILVQHTLLPYKIHRLVPPEHMKSLVRILRQG